MPMLNYPNPRASGLPQCRSSMPASRDDDSRRRRRQDYDREYDSSSPRDKYRPPLKSTSSAKLVHRRRRSRSRDRDRERDSPRSATFDRPEAVRIPARKASMVVPEMERRPSGEVKPQSSYPSFSKAHSREAIGSREDVTASKAAPSTPEANEGRRENIKRRNSTPAETNGTATRTPPSPPFTGEAPDIKRSGSGKGMRDGGGDDDTFKLEAGRKSADRSKSVKDTRSSTSLQKDAQSELSSMPGAFPEEETRSTPNGSYRRTDSTASQSQPSSSVTDNTTDSDATSVAPDRKAQRPNNAPTTTKTSAEAEEDSQPTTPNREPINPTQGRKTPSIDVGVANAPVQQPRLPSLATPLTAKHVPPPPPPPPAVSESSEAPRVDYLLKNGGLTNPVPKRLVISPGAAPVQTYNVYQSPALSQASPMEEYAKVFSSLHKRLDDYLHVLQNNGSLAVATGYKSVARRLLDKLSQVFARDIASQRCDCVVCRNTPQPNLSDEEDSGVSWGEILEFVSGRRELPQWPPFSIEPDENGLGISGTTRAPMQKLDIDVPDEYRDHYIRQNQKTKRAVQTWLSHQPDYPSSPPEEADEDTLMFAMMTKLNVQQRNLFIALMHGQSFISESRAPTPAERPPAASDILKRARKALQRLYRIDRPPRDCETALYMLNNPHLHGMLATLAEVNEAEWEILTSGRFDGFLWSGAEAPMPPSASSFASPMSSRFPSRFPNATPISRNTTPFSGFSLGSLSRTTTPFSNGSSTGPSPTFPSRDPTPGPNGLGVSTPAPVQLDEDTEIAVAAELERNLYLDMERLEDAFEILHGRAELVRQMLRERSAGLSAQAQLRRGSNAGDPIGVRLNTPASGVTDIEQDYDDDGLGETVSLAPDDSASQVSTNRRHRHRRERRTPNPDPVIEENESVFEEYDRLRKERSGRRSKH